MPRRVLRVGCKVMSVAGAHSDALELRVDPAIKFLRRQVFEEIAYLSFETAVGYFDLTRGWNANADTGFEMTAAACLSDGVQKLLHPGIGGIGIQTELIGDIAFV